MIQKRFMKSEEISVLSAMMTAKSFLPLGSNHNLWRFCLYLSIFHPPSTRCAPHKNTQQAARCHRLIHGNRFCCLPFTDPKLFHWATRILQNFRGIQHQLGTNNGISQDLTLSTSRISRACENGWKMMGFLKPCNSLQLNSTRRS